MQQSLCAEMAEEFCFAIRCKNSGQRPAFKRKCSQCVTHCSFPRGALDHSVSTHHVPTNGLGKPLWHPVSSNCLTNNICHSLRFPRRFRRPAEWRRVRQHGRLIPETIFSLCLRLLKYLLLLRNTFNTKLLFECLRSNNKNIYIYILSWRNEDWRNEWLLNRAELYELCSLDFSREFDYSRGFPADSLRVLDHQASAVGRKKTKVHKTSL